MVLRPSIQAVIIDPNKKKVLLIKKIDVDNDKEAWSLVKGGIEKDEDEVKALKREVEEEVGITDINIKRKVHWYEYLWKDLEVTVSSYLVEADSGISIKLQEQHDDEYPIVEYGWFTKEDAIEKVFWQDEKKAIELAFIDR